MPSGQQHALGLLAVCLLMSQLWVAAATLRHRRPEGYTAGCSTSACNTPAGAVGITHESASPRQARMDSLAHRQGKRQQAHKAAEDLHTHRRAAAVALLGVLCPLILLAAVLYSVSAADFTVTVTSWLALACSLTWLMYTAVHAVLAELLVMQYRQLQRLLSLCSARLSYSRCLHARQLL